MRYYSVLFLLTFVISGCGEKKSDSMQMAQDTQYELRNDSLFLGYYFGMPMTEFFEHSFQKNKEGEITNGSGREVVRSLEDLKAPAKMYFFPLFRNDEIFVMPIMYAYDGWAPWNPDLSADSLQQDLKHFFADSMNISFEESLNPEDSSLVLTSSKRNKEITISLVSQSKVSVIFKDLSQVEN